MRILVGASWYDVDVRINEAEMQPPDPIPDNWKKALADPSRFDPLHKTLNAKSIGSRKTLSSEKNVIAAFTKALGGPRDKKAYDKAKVAWNRYKSTMDTSFQNLVKQLGKGEVTKNQFMNSARKLFKAGYEKAYRLGTDAGGMAAFQIPAQDLKWLARARTAEYKFLSKFADTVVAGKGSMAYDKRASMYVTSLDGVFDAGRVDAYPNETTKVYWELSASENCGDCIDLAMSSPFTPDTLPTTPRAGGTRCLSNCGCHLRIRYDAAAGAAANSSVNVTPATGAKPSGEEAEGQAWPEGLDWNAIDDMMTALATLRILEGRRLDLYRLREEQRSRKLFVTAARKLPEWLDPFSREVYAWHMIGAAVLDKVYRKEM